VDAEETVDAVRSVTRPYAVLGMSAVVAAHVLGPLRSHLGERRAAARLRLPEVGAVLVRFLAGARVRGAPGRSESQRREVHQRDDGERLHGGRLLQVRYQPVLASGR